MQFGKHTYEAPEHPWVIPLIFSSVLPPTRLPHSLMKDNSNDRNKKQQCEEDTKDKEKEEIKGKDWNESKGGEGGGGKEDKKEEIKDRE